MIDYVNILKQFPNGVLATQGEKDVHTGVFQYQFAEGNKLYFCTQSIKPVYDRIIANPNVSFCTYTPDFAPVVSVNGKAVFTEDTTLKMRAINENSLIKEIYQTPDNPIFKLFYIDVEHIKTFSFAEGTKSYKL